MNMNVKINDKLNPMWVTGFSDGESSFSLAISRCDSHKTGYKLMPAFAIKLKDKDLNVLYKIKHFFKDVGRIHLIKNKGHVIYVVNSIYELQNVIIPHFINYPLLTIKRITFLFFKEIIYLMYTKKHLSIEGLETIINYRSFMNKNVTEELLKTLNISLSMFKINSLTVKDINNN
jgi:LAGLIDADG endonuclease